VGGSALALAPVALHEVHEGVPKYLCSSILVFAYALHRTDTEDFALTTNH
jgi:hypothetical protein